MKSSWNRTSRDSAPRLGLCAILVALCSVAPAGCTREFFREWANQDASEAVFEKSRDPRWRIDMFSIEQPGMSRFADPYDQDVPPAPPDDPAAEALSPVPQWPDNRLMIPVEGTGYQDLLEYWQRDREAKLVQIDLARQAIYGASGNPLRTPTDLNGPEYWQRLDNGRHPVTDPRQMGLPGQPSETPGGRPEPPPTGSPFSGEPPPSIPPPRQMPAAPDPATAPAPGGATPETPQPLPPSAPPRGAGSPSGSAHCCSRRQEHPGLRPCGSCVFRMTTQQTTTAAPSRRRRSEIRLPPGLTGRPPGVRRPYLYRQRSIRRRSARFRHLAPGQTMEKRTPPVVRER